MDSIDLLFDTIMRGSNPPLGPGSDANEIEELEDTESGGIEGKTVCSAISIKVDLIFDIRS
jgi:hypothetical protein